MSRQAAAVLIFILTSVFLLPHRAIAQNTGIAGAVRDTSGGVIPGVTVEASSPVLIEKVRTAVTDSQGLYSIVDLRPGVYTVTFTLPGFTTVKREGIELTGSFTATVNAEMKVGQLEETITVSGQTPIVDTRNVVQQRVLSDEVREALPTGRSVQMMAQIIPGITQNPVSRPSGQDVGGLSGERGTLMIHGSRATDFRLEVDGSSVNIGSTGGNAAYNLNPTEAQEFVYELGGVSAETITGGIRVNVIPKEGGNRFSGQMMLAYVSDSMQAQNLTDSLRAQGLQAGNDLEKTWDYNFAFGGPIKKDNLWFFVSYRDWGVREKITGMFRPIDPLSFVFDPSQGAAGNVDLNRRAVLHSWLHTANGRLTWQATPKNKFTFYGAHYPRDQDGAYMSGVRSYEAAIHQEVVFGRVFQGVWKSPVTSRLLLEANYADVYAHVPQNESPGITPDIISAMDIGTGILFRAANNYSIYYYDSPNAKFAASYVTGAHAFKVGFQYDWGYDHQPYQRENGSVLYTLRNSVPVSLTQTNSPRDYWGRYRNAGLFVQDQWTMKRLTVNAGVRFDYHNEWIPEQTSGPGPFAPRIVWPEVRDVPNWKDVSPRFGVVYDLFGNGKTALKGTVSRYVTASTVVFSNQNNPLNFNRTANRTWNDANRDYIPQASELGPLSNRNFATAATTTRVDDAIREGWGARPYNWEYSAGVQQELFPNASASVTYIKRSYGNFNVIDNLAITPADYDPFCIAAPANPRLPGGGGNQVCGLYDLNPSKLGLQNNLRTDAANYGKQTETFNGIDVALNLRLPRRVVLSGGLSTGTSSTTGATTTNSTNECFVVDAPGTYIPQITPAFAPNVLRFCEVNVKWQTSVRFLGTVGLPWGIETGATFQANPGPEILANYTVTSAQVQGLGRPLTFGTMTVPLVPPGTMFGDRIYQLDLRFSKLAQLRGVRLRLNLDLANALNSSAVLLQNNTYGTNWLRPSYILPGRLIRPSVQIDF
jgi:hypothetical protein